MEELVDNTGQMNRGLLKWFPKFRRQIAVSLRLQGSRTTPSPVSPAAWSSTKGHPELALQRIT
eukprot:258670-Hanusia_phi.AAC.1